MSASWRSDSTINVHDYISRSLILERGHAGRGGTGDLDDTSVNDEGHFRANFKIFRAIDNFMHFIVQRNDVQIKATVKCCESENTLFENAENVKSISFLKSEEYFERCDTENRTWLHVAVIHNRKFVSAKTTMTTPLCSITARKKSTT